MAKVAGTDAKGAPALVDVEPAAYKISVAALRLVPLSKDAVTET
jgi:hypothetical protein